MQKSILVIEDETDMREAIVTALEQADFHVISAQDGEEGMQKAQEHQPDLILLDLLMPTTDGQEVLKKLRDSEWGSSIKVIILTAMDDVKNVGTAYQTGVSDYITKSEISLVELVKKVKDSFAS